MDKELVVRVVIETGGLGLADFERELGAEGGEGHELGFGVIEFGDGIEGGVEVDAGEEGGELTPSGGLVPFIFDVVDFIEEGGPMVAGEVGGEGRDGLGLGAFAH